MPTTPVYNFSFIGSNGKTVVRRFKGQTITDVDEATELGIAMSNLNAIRTELDDITDANIDSSMTVQGAGAAGGIPADADVFEEAALSLDITPAGEPNKLATISIPAPSDGVFLAATGPNKDVVDVNDADLGAFITELVDHVLVSDGEEINSLVSGYRRARGGRTS
jgi:hypothetical protein